MFAGLSVGAGAYVSGAHGRFLAPSGPGRQVWVAAGIGITPFLAWAEALGARDGPVDLFYCVPDPQTAPHLSDLRAITEKKSNFRLHLVCSTRDGRLTPELVAEVLEGGLGSAKVWFCGPKAMRIGLRTALIKAGLPTRRFHYEEFEIRSGIDIARPARCLLARLRARLKT